MKDVIQKIVITGAPGSGKTGLINRLRDMAEFKIFSFCDEIARELLKSNPEYRDNWIDFHKEIYRRHIERESKIVDCSFITDRGTLDALAFCSTAMKEADTTIELEYNRYTAVLLLGSAASLGDEYYQTDSERLEPAEEAKEIEKRLKDAWSGHPHFYFVEAYKDIEEKNSRSIAILRQMIVKNKINSTNRDKSRL